MSGITYSEAGVDIELGDQASDILYLAAKETWENRHGLLGEVICPFDDFSGLRTMDISALPNNTMMGLNFDGVGTKMEIAERINKHDTIAYDLFAMVCDDAVVRGGEPAVIGSVLDVNTLGRDEENYINSIKQLANGYKNAAKDANVAVINGELAELGNRVQGFGGFNYNWSAGLIWFARKDRILTGRSITPGDSIIGLREKGIRSNGLSLIRKILSNVHGENWHEMKINERSIAKIAVEPSKIYSKAVVDMIGGVDSDPKTKIHGVAHITGGGIPSKLGRVLKPTNLGAFLDNLFEPPEIVKYCQEMGKILDCEAYTTWNMGQGMLIISPEPEIVIEVSKKHSIDAREVGKITENKGIKLVDKGFYSKTDQILEF
jgi:phosphoribosylformylglycinamidine cyclo-ligase